MSRVRILGLTGGIGSGKSTASARFASLGAHVLDADGVSRASMQKGGACYEAVKLLFGERVMRETGEFDRRAIAEIVFQDEQKRRALNAIIHPHVTEVMRKEAQAICAQQENPLIIYDVPLLFESGMDADCDAVAAIVCNEQTRVIRVLARDPSATREGVLTRIRAQMSDAERMMRADYILDNNGATDSLYRQIDALYQSLTSGQYDGAF